MYKKFKSLASVVGVALIGSAFWEFLFRDLVVGTARMASLVLGAFSTTYVDRFYSNLCKADTVFVAMPFISIVMLVLAVTILSTRKLFSLLRDFEHKKELYASENLRSPIDESVTKSGKLKVVNKKRPNRDIIYLIAKKMLENVNRFIITTKIIVGILIFMNIEAIMVHTIKYGNQINIERDLIIVKPFIRDGDIDMYYSEYMLIDNKKSYDRLENKIDSVANKNKIILPTNNYSL